MRRDAATVASWDFTRIIPCHGVGAPHLSKPTYDVNTEYLQDVIEDKGHEAWVAAYSKYLDVDKK